jgi:hypothetical protein
MADKTESIIYIRRNPRTLFAVLSVVADDLHIGEEKGYRVTDSSRSLGDPSRVFYVKTILLFMQGDYKAQALNCGQAHQGGFPCHWCKHNPSKIAGVNRHVSGGYSSYYPIRHANRPFDALIQPASREHDATCLAAMRNAAARDRRIRDPQNVAEEDKAEHIDGVKEWCPLAILAFFCVIWDFVPDMMHMVYNLLKTYIVKLMKGERKPKMPRFLKLDGYEGEELRQRRDQNRQTLGDFKLAKEVIANS